MLERTGTFQWKVSPAQFKVYHYHPDTTVPLAFRADCPCPAGARPAILHPMIQALATADERLYMRIFRRLAQSIDQGAMRPGDRIPSVRRLARQEGISISTVLQAYTQLEAKGYIEARPQSGFYVKPRLRQAPAEPRMSKPSARATAVSASELTLKILKAVRDPELVAFGTAVPSPALLPVQQLNRMMGAIGRRNPSSGTSYDVPPGAPPLRIQVARRALDYGCLLSPDEIVTTTGCQEALEPLPARRGRAGRHRGGGIAHLLRHSPDHRLARHEGAGNSHPPAGWREPGGAAICAGPGTDRGLSLHAHLQ